MGDERDQDVDRTPLWPPDPEPGGETPALPTWSADPSPAPSHYQPWDAPATPQPTEAQALWPPEPPPSVSEAPTEHMEAFPTLSESEWPTERVEALPIPSVSDAPTAHVEALPIPSVSEAPTAHVEVFPAPQVNEGAPMRVSAAPAMPDAATQRAFPAPPAMPDAATQRAFPAPPAYVAHAEPAAPPTPPAPPAQKPAPKPAPSRRSGLLWRLGITFAISVLLLVGALSLYRHAQDLAAEPVTLMASYCTAIEHDDYRAAYALLASGAQAQITETQYLSDAADRDIIEGRVTACAATPTETLSPLSFLRSPRSLIFNVKITRKQASSGQIAISRDTSGWHVAALSSSLQGIDLGPLATQRALCVAFNQRKYDQAYALLSTPYQREQGSATTFAKAFGDSLTITACAANLKTYTVNSTDQQATLDATLTLSFVGATTGSPPNVFTAPSQWTLVREATGWRVDNIKPMLTQ